LGGGNRGGGKQEKTRKRGDLARVNRGLLFSLGEEKKSSWGGKTGKAKGGYEGG